MWQIQAATWCHFGGGDSALSMMFETSSLPVVEAEATFKTWATDRWSRTCLTSLPSV
jgi:hypothetical protein